MEQKATVKSVFLNGILSENPTFRLVLGTCPTMAVTTSATNGIGMGAAATFVLVGSNVVISLLRNFIPDKIRIPAFIVVICTFVTMVQMFMQAFLPSLYSSLGIFLPLIVVNCIILGRAEAFAVKNGIVASAVDGLAMGLGFTGALTFIGLIREFLGSGTLFAQASNLLGPSFAFLEMKLPGYGGALLMILPPGGFAILGFLLAGKRVMEKRLEDKAAARGELATA